MSHRNTVETFWEKVDKNGPIPEHRPELGPCWIWTGYIQKNGYVLTRLRHESGRRDWMAHRLAYELEIGKIGFGLTIDHLCRVRHCVNPNHLEAVTAGENALRGFGPPAMNKRKTICKRGHQLRGKNLYVHPRSGERNCRTCTKLKMRRRRAAKKSLVYATYQSH